MTAFMLFSTVVLWIVVIGVGFLLIGVLRAHGLLTWRLDQLEATTPRRIGRDGINPGRNAPDFTLPSVPGGHASLSDFAGKKLLVVFTQSGCGPCADIVPELNRLHDRGEEHVLVVNNGSPEETGRWAAEVRARFPVLVQEGFSLSRRYEVFATPFGFLIDERGTVISKGIVSSRQYLLYVLGGAGTHRKREPFRPHAPVSSESPLPSPTNAVVQE